MSWRIIRSLIAKDLTLFLRNRFFAPVTALALVAYVTVYFVMPGSVDETLDLAVYAADLPLALEQVQQAQGAGISIQLFQSADALKAAVEEGKYQAGIVLPDGFQESLAAGKKVRLDVYFASQASAELRAGIETLLRELTYVQSGHPLPIEISEEVFGKDMVGNQVPMRDRLVPLIAMLILMMETIGLASLISEEVESRTVNALLVTPMTYGGLFTAKAVTGVGLAFGQAALFLAATGGFNQGPLAMLVALLLGSVLVTGVGFLIASVGKDLMSVMAWAIPSMVVLGVPMFGVLFPGMLSGWVKAIPTYYLADSMYRATSLGTGLGEVWTYMLALLAFGVTFIGLGVLALKRRLQ